MNEEKDKSAQIWLILGIILGCFLSLTINAIIVNASIRQNDPSTWPNMGPGVRIMFFPVIALILFPVVIFLEAIIKKYLKLKYKNKFAALIVGASYTTWLILTSPGWYGLVLVILFNPLTAHLLLANSAKLKR